MIDYDALLVEYLLKFGPDALSYGTKPWAKMAWLTGEREWIHEVVIPLDGSFTVHMHEIQRRYRLAVGLPPARINR